VTRGVLEARDLVFRRGGLHAVDHVDIEAAPGRVTAVIGPNGAGKSTLFDCLSGELRPASGHVLLDGRDVTRLSADQRSRAGVARTFQRSAVFPSLTVGENLRIGSENRRRQGAWRGVLGIADPDATAAAARVEQIIENLGLGSLRDVMAGRLPTGTLRIVELGRALCTNPSVLLLDEPASGLDDSEVDRFRELIAGFAADGLSVILVEHDIDLVVHLADVVYAMAGGRMLASGAPDAVVAQPDVRSIVLGIRQ
jgi:branched-chain amino acid transport system ATP-binding protein